MSVMSLAQRLSLYIKRVASVSRQKHRVRAVSNQTRSTRSQRRITASPAIGHSSLAKASYVGPARFQSELRYKWAPQHPRACCPLLGLVAASRLGLDHVVTRRRLRQPNELCVTLRSPATRAIVSNCTGDGGARPSTVVQTRPRKATQARTNVEPAC